MNVSTAAISMIAMIRESNLPDSNPEYGKDHLYEMVQKINRGEVTGEKSHRWLGYIQGCLVSSNSATLEQVKNIKHKA